MISVFLTITYFIEPILASLSGESWVVNNTYVNPSNIISFSTVAGSFMHIDVEHLLRNVATIVITIPIVRTVYDIRHTLLIFVISAIWGSLVFILSSKLLNTEVLTRGSSGATFALIGISWYIVSKNRKVLFVPNYPVFFGLTAVVVYETSTIIFEQSVVPDNPAVSVVHISSFLLGIYITSATKSGKTPIRITNLSGFIHYNLRNFLRIVR
jgi:membrane associated rhomboid family serine protease